MFTKVMDGFYTVVWALCKALLLAQVFIVAYVVFGRFVLHSTPAWGEETALICMVWFCLISATLPVRDNTHLRMTIIEMFLPAKVIKMIDKANHVITFCFGLFMVVSGFEVTKLTTMNVLPGIGITAAWLYVAVPLAGFTLIFALLEKVRKDSI